MKLLKSVKFPLKLVLNSKFIAALLLAACLSISTSSIADDTDPVATTQPTTTDGSGTGGGTDVALSKLTDICSVSVTDSDTKEIKIFSVGVKCFENLIDGAAQNAISKLSQRLASAVYALLALYLIFVGSKISLGMSGSGEGVKKEFIIVSLKVAFVAWLVFSLGLVDVYGLVLQAYESLISIVLSGADYGDCNSATTGTTGGTSAIWDTMDCMFSKFLGWNTQNGYGATWSNVPLLFGLISGKMLPANGFFVGGILFSSMWSLMMGFFRMAFIYIISMIALILLFAISPLIVPMLLFEKTRQYFDGWWKLCVSMILQPVILFAFFAFVASIMTQTVSDLQNIYSQLKPAYQTTGTDQNGNTMNVHQTYDAVGNLLQNADKQLVLYAVSTLVVAYLLISFINIVTTMAQQLAGTAFAPNLGDLAKFGSK